MVDLAPSALINNLGLIKQRSALGKSSTRGRAYGHSGSRDHETPLAATCVLGIAFRIDCTIRVITCTVECSLATPGTLANGHPTNGSPGPPPPAPTGSSSKAPRPRWQAESSQHTAQSGSTPHCWAAFAAWRWGLPFFLSWPHELLRKGVSESNVKSRWPSKKPTPFFVGIFALLKGKPPPTNHRAGGLFVHGS